MEKKVKRRAKVPAKHTTRPVKKKKVPKKQVHAKVSEPKAPSGPTPPGQPVTESAISLPKKKYELKLSDTKIRCLLDVAHLEELMHVLDILSDEEIKTFLEHYKSREIDPTQDTRVDVLVRDAKTPYDLKVKVKDEFVRTLRDRYDDLRHALSRLRKKGVDVYIEDLRSLTIPPKIKMFSSTLKKEDYTKVFKIITELETITKEKERALEETARQTEAAKNPPPAEKKEDAAPQVVKQEIPPATTQIPAAPPSPSTSAVPITPPEEKRSSLLGKAKGWFSKKTPARTTTSPA